MNVASHPQASATGMKPATPIASRLSDIVAVATCTSPWNPAVEVAATLAARWQSLLTGCFVDESLRMLRGPESEPSVLGLLLDTPVQNYEEGDQFRSFARSKGAPHASWVVAHTGLARVLRELGAWHSMAVLERDVVEGDSLAELLGEVLITCRLPSLILPSGWDRDARFSRVLVAWDGSVEATRAIHAALPFLQDAQRVVLLDGGRPHRPEGECYLPHFEPFVYMARHGVEADPMCVGVPARAAGAALLKKAEQVGADLIVMGAFGHSRLRENVIGGATRYMLEHSRIPVFLQH
ncbi:universal stress protein [Frateuria terrea]|uniref:Universal stress protein family protein n=1 Tax=Frateuria terrea TaxID=529704 RepID=A0A1H6UYW3_9GAMM|nr:universal stress protein [Frateuria terrea]SEI94777.1 Universal stress protein family protein [Frateuria terrea]SFP33797.1 Universal stress protein family protein [Frateuria terrea]